MGRWESENSHELCTPKWPCKQGNSDNDDNSDDDDNANDNDKESFTGNGMQLWGNTSLKCNSEDPWDKDINLDLHLLFAMAMEDSGHLSADLYN